MILYHKIIFLTTFVQQMKVRDGLSIEPHTVNSPIRLGGATVLPGDQVLAKTEGVLLIPASLAEEAISTAEFTALNDDHNFELNSERENGAQFEGGWFRRIWQRWRQPARSKTSAACSMALA